MPCENSWQGFGNQEKYYVWKGNAIVMVTSMVP
jgi:hypothetical protein